MFQNLIYNRKEYVLLACAYVILGVYYVSHLVTSGLQYDEAIEYFYSKYLTGAIPGISDKANMYERIVYTYQPPLYNVLMYCWLRFFDSEALFRLAGVITTFIGSFGFYLSLRKIVDYRWAITGISLYLSAYSVMYFALECAEYNLMLCMECWMLYFFVGCVVDGNAARLKNILCFYLFATLSIYSQYGAAFSIVSLFLVLVFHYFRKKDFKSLKNLLIVGIVTCVLFVLPLYIWFLHPQMLHQESIGVAHDMVFVKNAVYSFVLSLYNNISWILTYIYATHLSVGALASVMLSSFCTIVMLIAVFKKASYYYSLCFMAFAICFLLFFIAGASSFYAYNHFEGGLGCCNIIEGKRYVLFIAPIFIFTLVMSFYSISGNLTGWAKKYNLPYFSFAGLTLLIYLWMWGYGVVVKGFEREATLAWIEVAGYNHPTLVQEEASGIFSFYFQHSHVYSDNCQNNIVIQGKRARNTNNEEMEAYLKQIGVFSNSEFYYVGSSVFLPSNFGEIFERHAYSIDKVYEKGNAILWHVCRKDHLIK